MEEQGPGTVAHVAMKRTQRINRWFYVGVALLMILLNLVGFGPSIIDASKRNVPLPFTLLVTMHAILSVAWLLLFLAQTTLVATGRTALHRRLGIFGAMLAVAFIVVGCFTVIAHARRGLDLSGDLSRIPPPPGADPAAVALSTLYFFLIFAVLFGAALWYRHRPSVHKRLMLLAVLGGLTGTPVAHVIGHWSVLHAWTGLIFVASSLIFLSFSAIHDRLSQGRIHPVSLWVALVLFVSTAVFNIGIVPSSAWRDFTTWLIQ
jgi:hypothetical protein